MSETAVEAMRSWTPGIIALGPSEPVFWSGVVTVGVDERSRGASNRQQEVALNEGPEAGDVSDGQALHARAEGIFIPQTLGAIGRPTGPATRRRTSTEAATRAPASRR